MGTSKPLQHTKSNGALPTPSKILITRLSAIGDCVLTIPLAVACKQLWPDVPVTWIVSCAARQFLEHHPAVDQVITVPKDWLKRLDHWPSLRRRLREEEFDLALDPQGLTKSAMLAWLSGARTRVGFTYSQAREVAPLMVNHRIKRTARHMVDAQLQLLSPWCDISSGAGQFQMPVYSEAARTAEEILEKQGLACEHWVGLNPGAGWTTRQWPVERFGLLARELKREFGRTSLVFWAGKEELLMAKVIEEESRGAAKIAPATNLPEMLELTRRSSLLVTGDTGPLHIASATGTPCVSLHGPTWSDVSGPYGNRHVAIQSPLCPQNGKLVRKGVNYSMQAIEVNEVQRACSKLIYEEPQLTAKAA